MGASGKHVPSKLTLRRLLVHDFHNHYLSIIISTIIIYYLPTLCYDTSLPEEGQINPSVIIDRLAISRICTYQSLIPNNSCLHPPDALHFILQLFVRFDVLPFGVRPSFSRYSSSASRLRHYFLRIFKDAQPSVGCSKVVIFFHE